MRNYCSTYSTLYDAILFTNWIVSMFRILVSYDCAEHAKVPAIPSNAMIACLDALSLVPIVFATCVYNSRVMCLHTMGNTSCSYMNHVPSILSILDNT